MYKLLGILFILGALGLAVLGVTRTIQANYQYDQGFKSYWNLADKSSTLEKKSEYIDKFVDALDKSGLHGTNDALFYKTNDNSFDKNFEALQSLQTRLHEIRTIDPNSFAYQTAIQQITSQEQGEADSMLEVFHSCWLKVHHYWQWNFFLFLLYIVMIVGLGGLGILILVADDNDRRYHY